ncbi:MAG: PocR ligand-binding domain-containing protein [Calditrichia bacterium]
MEDLLTTKQVLDLLKVDRTTIYRMINDGRLKAVKVGNHWRFPRKNIQDLIAVQDVPKSQTKMQMKSILPIHCIAPIQDVFAEIADVGSVTTSPEGEPLTHISNSCRFCDMIFSMDKGRQDCIDCWKKLAEQSSVRPQFVTCHAGLQYARARIELDGELAAMLIAGQFYTSQPDPVEEKERIHRLAGRYHLDEKALTAAAKEIQVIGEKRQKQIAPWLEKVAQTFEQVTRERAEFSRRLKKIADLSKIDAED